MLLAQNLNAIQSAAGLPSGNVNMTPAGWINLILPYIFFGSGLALVIYITIGGLQFMLSRGDPKAVAAAQAKITYSVIGFVIIALAFSLVQLFGTIFGITVFGQIFK